MPTREANLLGKFAFSRAPYRTRRNPRPTKRTFPPPQRERNSPPPTYPRAAPNNTVT
jgi:hypothetical protein